MHPIDPERLAALRLFDANCRIGTAETSGDDAPVTASALLAEMDRHSISEALVYHSWAVGYHPAHGNDRLSEETRGAGRLRRCWVVMPHHTGEMERPAPLVERMVADGVRAARIFPTLHRFSLGDWSAGQLLGALEARRVPLLIDFNRGHWAEEVVDYDAVARVCGAHPALPVILVREGIGSSRYLYPLLESFPNLHLELSYYQVSSGIADIVKRFGARRLLFGTGLPVYAAGPACAMLYFAEIPEEEKRAIAGDNLRRLLAGVR
jgi:predicted TIM-barrel fold metal-dependent hydrolase